MKFICLLEDLKKQYENDIGIRRNGTMLLGPGKIPRSRHMLFVPLLDEHIGYLVDAYQNDFPEEYIEFLKYSNGANLFCVKLTKTVTFAYSMFSIYGLPMQPPFSRPDDEEEPFDLRIEDFARHENIPGTWLKCGAYIKDEIFGRMINIFIDTETKHVYACEKNKSEILDDWDSLDECFCSVFESLADCKEEYEY